MEKQQIETFDNVIGNTKTYCNEFLKTIPSEKIVSINSFYNTILGGVIYVVVYKTDL